jgi:hypothetical protein
MFLAACPENNALERTSVSETAEEIRSREPTNVPPKIDVRVLVVNAFG